MRIVTVLVLVYKSFCNTVCIYGHANKASCCCCVYRTKDPREVYSRRAPAFLSESSFLSVHTGLTEGPLVKGNYRQTKVNCTPEYYINELII